MADPNDIKAMPKFPQRKAVGHRANRGGNLIVVALIGFLFLGLTGCAVGTQAYKHAQDSCIALDGWLGSSNSTALDVAYAEAQEAAKEDGQYLPIQNDIVAIGAGDIDSRAAGDGLVASNDIGDRCRAVGVSF